MQPPLNLYTFCVYVIVLETKTRSVPVPEFHSTNSMQRNAMKEYLENTTLKKLLYSSNPFS
jgi:hypothetical protein